MPTPTEEFIRTTPTVPVSVVLEPALNALNSLIILTKNELMPGTPPWVTDAAALLSPEQLRTHRLVFIGLYHALPIEGGHTSFLDYVNALARRDPATLSEKILDIYLNHPPISLPEELPTPKRAELLADAQYFIDYLRITYPPGNIFEDIERQAHHLLSHPAQLQSIIVNHLRDMWTLVLSKEWARIEPMLQESVNAFRQVDLSQVTLAEAVRLVTGQEPGEGLEHWLEKVEQLIFVPSAHVGPYLGKLGAPHQGRKTLWLFFGARLPQGVKATSAELSRSELLVRLNALADDTRLRMLKLIADSGELCAPDIQVRLDISQPATSRHVRQLTATGYLHERRVEGSKCYSLNRLRVDETVQAIEQYLLGD
ncbi:MAG: winged helix-turn-helix transcriptional regulator [Chloroflexi bacterium]|nr:winged helix-turn-helix transcriptional regulator [Chloroflexota bacterium]